MIKTITMNGVTETKRLEKYAWTSKAFGGTSKTTITLFVLATATPSTLISPGPE